MKEADFQEILLVVPTQRVETKKKVLSVVDLNQYQATERRADHSIEFDRSIGRRERSSTREIRPCVAETFIVADQPVDF